MLGLFGLHSHFRVQPNYSVEVVLFWVVVWVVTLSRLCNPLFVVFYFWYLFLMCTNPVVVCRSLPCTFVCTTHMCSVHHPAHIFCLKRGPCPSFVCSTVHCSPWWSWWGTCPVPSLLPCPLAGWHSGPAQAISLPRCWWDVRLGSISTNQVQPDHSCWSCWQGCPCLSFRTSLSSRRLLGPTPWSCNVWRGCCPVCRRCCWRRVRALPERHQPALAAKRLARADSGVS